MTSCNFENSRPNPQDKIQYRGLTKDWTNMVSNKNIPSPSGDSHPAFELYEEPEVKFAIPGTTYKGEWNKLGFWGNGKFVFPSGVFYQGEIKDSMFHGQGILKYPMGQVIIGRWENGILKEWEFKLFDGPRFSDPWKYCSFPDRRFFIEYEDNFRSVCDTFLTNRQPTRKIPFGCYDTEEGFFNTFTKLIVSAINKNKVLRITSQNEEKWIKKHCRRAWDEPTGYEPENNETWTRGTADSMHEMAEYLQEIASRSPDESYKYKIPSSSSSSSSSMRSVTSQKSTLSKESSMVQEEKKFVTPISTEDEDGSESDNSGSLNSENYF